MKFRAHDTFFIRKGWLSKGMKSIIAKNDIFVAKDENPMDILGVGANMVKALRYWLQAVGLTEEQIGRKRVQILTELGIKIFKHDRYIEEFGTLLLLQYKIASNKDEATAWYFFFNEFSMSEFSRDDFVDALHRYINMSGKKEEVATRSLVDDFSCIVGTYLPRYKSSPGKSSPESNIDCPFGELGLIDILNKKKKTYKKSTPYIGIMNPWIALAVIIDNAKGRKEIPINELMTTPCNIGRVFNLDSITLLDILYSIERLGEIKIIRSAGLDVIYILNDLKFSDCIDRYYSEINMLA